MKLKTIKQNWSDQETLVIRKVLANILIVIAGVVLFLDKIFYMILSLPKFEVNYYQDSEVFLWYLGQSFSPILLILALFLGNYNKILLSIPGVTYLIQVYWISSDVQSQSELITYFVIALIFSVVVIFYLVSFIVRSLSYYKSGYKKTQSLVWKLRHTAIPKILSLQMLGRKDQVFTYCEELDKEISQEIAK